MPHLRLIKAGAEAGTHGGEVFSVAFAAEAGLVLSGGWDGHLRLWEADGGTPVTALHVAAKAVSACAV